MAGSVYLEAKLEVRHVTAKLLMADSVYLEGKLEVRHVTAKLLCP